MLRDARINLIGEGANEVLTSFIALVGMRDPGEELRQVRDSLFHPWRQRAVLGRFTAGRWPVSCDGPACPCSRPSWSRTLGSSAV